MKRLYILLLSLVAAIAGFSQISDTGVLRSYINANIIPNSQRAITATQMNTILNGVLNVGYKLRGVDTAFVVNDSTIRYKLNGTVYNLVVKGRDLTALNNRIDSVSHIYDRQQGTRFSTKPVIKWSGVGLKYYVMFPDYWINGKFFRGFTDSFTLAAAPVTQYRRDGIVADTLRHTVVLQGDSADAPVDPTVDDASQILAGYISINPGDTIPRGITSEYIYRNGFIPPDWDTVLSRSISGVDYQSTTSYHSPPYAVNIPPMEAHGGVWFQKLEGKRNIDSVSAVSLWFRLKTSFWVLFPTGFYITLYNENGKGLGKSVLINPGSYGLRNDTVWHPVIVPAELFGTGFSFKMIRIYFPHTNGAGYYLDDIDTQGGASEVAPTVTPKYTRVVADVGTTSATQENSPIFIKGGKNSSTRIVGDTTFVDVTRADTFVVRGTGTNTVTIIPDADTTDGRRDTLIIHGAGGGGGGVSGISKVLAGPGLTATTDSTLKVSDSLYNELLVKVGLAAYNTRGDSTATALAGKVSLSGSYANPAWITSLAWSKITSTPTTVSGYGITDAYPLSGNPSGFLTGNQSITLSGDVSGSGTTSISTALATVNGNVGSFGNSTTVPTITVNAKGLVTAASQTAIPNAGAGTTGMLTSTDWNTFNGKQAALTLTTTGTGNATLIGAALNIPNTTTSPAGSGGDIQYNAAGLFGGTGKLNFNDSILRISFKAVPPAVTVDTMTRLLIVARGRFTAGSAPVGDIIKISDSAGTGITTGIIHGGMSRNGARVIDFRGSTVDMTGNVRSTTGTFSVTQAGSPVTLSGSNKNNQVRLTGTLQDDNTAAQAGVSTLFTFAPTAGAFAQSAVLINPVWNQTGTASGPVVGIDYLPTSTSILGKEISARFPTGLFAIGLSDPTSTLHVVGSVSHSISTKSADYTATISDYTLLVDASGANRTITLPAASTCSGRVYVVKKIDSSGNNVVIDGNGSETIDGATTKTVSTQYSGWTIQSNGTAWYIIL